MRISRILCLSAAILIPQLAAAELPFPNGWFGNIDGMLDFCAKANPESAQKYLDAGKSLVKKLPVKDVEGARKSKEYTESRDKATDQLEKTLSKEDQVKTCKEMLGATE